MAVFNAPQPLRWAWDRQLGMNGPSFDHADEGRSKWMLAITPGAAHRQARGSWRRPASGRNFPRSGLKANIHLLAGPVGTTID